MSKVKRTFKIVGVAALSSALLASTAPQEEPLYPRDAKPTIVESLEPVDSGAPELPAWLFDQGSLIYFGGGSGSCPPVVEEAWYSESEDTIYLDLYAPGDNVACTADFRLFTQAITVFDRTPMTQEGTKVTFIEE